MKRSSKYLLMVLGAAFVVSLVLGPAIAAEPMSLVGTVNDNYQIVTEDDETYFIGENEKGDELIQHVDRKVRVTGMVQKSEDEKVIMITSYEIIEE
jgi:hypothetical protein